ncbi:MAG: nucleotidyltransferase family protein [Coleofasciculaceae cyanobacterium]
MKTLDEIKEILHQYKPMIRDKYKVSELGIFGSYIRGEQNEESDVDLLIDYEEAPSLLQLIDLENYLSDRLGIKVDVVTKRGLKPRIKERILSNVIYV